MLAIRQHYGSNHNNTVHCINILTKPQLKVKNEALVKDSLSGYPDCMSSLVKLRSE